MATNKHELAQSIAEAVMKQNSNFKSEFNAESIASVVYDILLNENRSIMPISEPEPVWNKTVAQIVNEKDNETGMNWDTDTLLLELSDFIQKNSSQKSFEDYLDMIANSYIQSDELDGEDADVERWKDEKNGLYPDKIDIAN